MHTDIDWARELDESFGAGEDVVVGHYVAAGHTAVRRRRAVFSAAGIAAALVLGTVWILAPGNAPRSTEVPIATEPTSSRSAEPDTTAVDRARSRMPWGKGDPPVRVMPDSTGPEVRKGATVHEVRNDLYPGKDTDSAAFDVTYDDTRWWVTLEWDAGGSAMTSSPIDEALYDTFDEFVAAAVDTGGLTHGPTNQDTPDYTDLVSFHDGKVELRRGAIELERVADPIGLLPEANSVGLVIEADGVQHWVLLTSDRSGGTGSYEEAAESGWLTFDQWLADQVDLQTGTPRLRLVDLEDDGTVRPAAPGVEVLDQRAEPDLPAYGTGEVPSALALVTWQGERWFVLIVRFDGDDGITTFAAEKADGAETLDDFIAFAADRADEGGLR